MRLAGIEKGGYYPYPLHMAEATASWFIPLSAGTRGRLLDPCAGEGEIASLLGRLLNCETWGCELFPYRAEKAAARMDKCHSAAWESCSLTDESVKLLWLNPPYDDDRHGEEKRLELAFLKSTTPKLVRGGVLAFVIPQRILRLSEIARCPCCSAASAGVNRKSAARISVNWPWEHNRARGRWGSSRVAMTRCIWSGRCSSRKVMTLSTGLELIAW
jgi:hypothetical protein